jgi:hypothetical protein
VSHSGCISLAIPLHSRSLFTRDPSSLAIPLHSRSLLTRDPSSLAIPLHSRSLFTRDSPLHSQYLFFTCSFTPSPAIRNSQVNAHRNHPQNARSPVRPHQRLMHGHQHRDNRPRQIMKPAQDLTHQMPSTTRDPTSRAFALPLHQQSRCHPFPTCQPSSNWPSSSPSRPYKATRTTLLRAYHYVAPLVEI